jgi:hypothetical protein
MGLYRQPNDWSCGPFALKHALAVLGRVADEADIGQHARTHWWSGTDEIGLADAADAYDCDLPQVLARRSDKARKRLLEQLRQGVPVLLCVDDWGHWICVVRYEAARFVIIDSDLDPILNVLTWSQLERRWRYLDYDYDEEDPPVRYDMYPVRPRFRRSLKADFSLQRVQYLRHKRNREFAHHWNTYLEDLLEICRPQSVQMVRPLSMAEFLRRHQELIVGRVDYWHGGVDRKFLLQLLKNFRFVAETYGLVIPEAKIKRATVDIAVLTAMWAFAAKGIGDMYGVSNP